MDIQIIQNKIYEIRGQRVMLDKDLALLYGVEVRALNQAVKRNLERFPPDFMFQLTADEWEILKSHFVTSSWGGVRKMPFAFTEQGVAMLSSILRSDVAIKKLSTTSVKIPDANLMTSIWPCLNWLTNKRPLRRKPSGNLLDSRNIHSILFLYFRKNIYVCVSFKIDSHGITHRHRRFA